MVYWSRGNKKKFTFPMTLNISKFIQKGEEG